MAASLEITSGIIRFGDNHNGKFTHYTGTLHLDPDGDIAVLKGAVGDLSLKDIADIAQVLIDQGFTHAKWQRLKGNEYKDVSVNLDRWGRRTNFDHRISDTGTS